MHTMMDGITRHEAAWVLQYLTRKRHLDWQEFKDAQSNYAYPRDVCIPAVKDSVSLRPPAAAVAPPAPTSTPPPPAVAPPQSRPLLNASGTQVKAGLQCGTPNPKATLGFSASQTSVWALHRCVRT